MFILRTGVVYVSDGSDTSRQLFSNAVKTIEKLDYANDKLHREFSRLMPSIKWFIPACTLNGVTAPAILIEKQPEVISLRDLLDHVGGKLDTRHVTWILTRLHSLLCYLQTAGITHNAIDLDSCFLSPENHSILLYGGWWYAKRHKEPLQFLPARSAQLWRTLPKTIIDEKRARHALDRASVRLLGRELLGDAGGTKLLHDSSIPKPLATWVSIPSGKNAITDFQQWEVVREQLGPRVFTPLDADASVVYAAPHNFSSLDADASVINARKGTT
jgi:hypothetical protein